MPEMSDGDGGPGEGEPHGATVGVQIRPGPSTMEASQMFEVIVWDAEQ